MQKLTITELMWFVTRSSSDSELLAYILRPQSWPWNGCS